MKWENTHIVDYRVTGHTDWIGILFCASVKPGFGVVLLANLDDHIKFIGTITPVQTLHTLTRMILKSKKQGTVRLRVLFTASAKDAAELREDLLNVYLPLGNHEETSQMSNKKNSISYGK